MKKFSKKSRFLSFVLIALIIFSTNVAAYAASDDLIITRENPPVNWIYAGEISYNRAVRDTTTAAVLSVLVPVLSGWATLDKETFASAIASSAVTAGVLGGFDIYIVKTGFYKTNTDGNGYPYYCHDIVETYRKDSSGKLTYLYTDEAFYYSYQYPEY
ncbi:MAG: hypothetical protein K0R54_2564 [Clostridiaceae bacterium]|jgi:hypothetical protein|nr:hypothetical protein [Clostridiaceae bacterium]